MLLQDKVVIVSGIGPGLGQQLSTLVAREGAKVVLAARTAAKLEAASREIEGLGLETSALTVCTDICSQVQCARLADETLERFGSIDVLINNAYTGGTMDPIESADMADWRTTMDTNLMGSVQMSQAAIPAMKLQGGGTIIMINSMVTHKPMAYNAGYAASKAALASATTNFALELGQYGIRFNSLFMGWMWGPNVYSYIEQTAKEQGIITIEQVKAGIAEHIALRRMPTDVECAKSVIIMTSDYSSAITGAHLDVNGGEFLPH